MTQKEEEFIAKLRATFKVEAEEHIKVLSDGLIALETQPDIQNQRELIETIFREAHSLKGGARAVNLVEIQDICQSMENVLSAWKAEKIHPSPELFTTLYATIDIVKNFITLSGSPQPEMSKRIPGLIEILGKLSDGKPVSEQTAATLAQTEQPSQTSSNATIRVSTQKLDKLFQQVEETLIIKLTASQRVAAMKEMQNELKKWEKRFGNGHQEFIKSFSENLDMLTKATAQDYRVIAGMVDTLLDDTKKVLMQPFSTLTEIFPRMVRDLSHSLGKEVAFHVSGSDIDIDRRILEELKDPITHLLRNSLDHGIELPEQREKSGKKKEGTISISATQISGNSMEIVISDDGAGVDPAKVKESALKQGAISSSDADTLTEQEIISLIFHSGVTTSPIITDLSGRGLGMGIVTEKVEKLGGQLFLESKKGVGTTFRIVLPVSLATFRGIHVRVSERDFIIPTHYVRRVIRIKPEEIKTIEGKETIFTDQKTISYVHLCDLLDMPRKTPDKDLKANEKRLVVIVKAAETLAAIGVDSILCEQEVFVKSLGKQLQRVRNFTAATVTEWGKVIPILDPYDLIKSLLRENIVKNTTAAPSGDKSILSKKTIIIAEDSLTARTLLKNILDTAGYTVKTAVDGAEAFSLLKTEHADLLLSDVEMPRMNGFELTRKVRGNEKLKDLPIVLCTSRGSKEDREQGIEAGANAYMDKSSFAQSNLLDIIQKLV